MPSSDTESSSEEMRSLILIVCDATKDRSIHEFRRTIHEIRMCGGILRPGDTIRVFGVLHKVLHPSKFVCVCVFLFVKCLFECFAILITLFCDG